MLYLVCIWIFCSIAVAYSMLKENADPTTAQDNKYSPLNILILTILGPITIVMWVVVLILKDLGIVKYN
jgi:hypothetical protein